MNVAVVASAWKSVDETLKLLERIAALLKPLHRDLEVLGLANVLRLRRQEPLFVIDGVAPVAAGDLRAVELPGVAQKSRARQLRPGVLVLDETSDLGIRRFFCDVARREFALDYANAGATMPALLDAVPDSSLDNVFAAFGAARMAWFSLDEMQKILRREIEALDRLADKLKAPAADNGRAGGDNEYLGRLATAVSHLLEEERERARDRESLQRIFLLAVRSVVAAQVKVDSVVQEIRPSAIDRFRPPGLRHLIGKTYVDVRLGNEAINQLVVEIDREALRVAEDRIHGMARTLEKIASQRFAQCFGATAELWLQPPQPKPAPSTHATLAISGAGFHFRFEQLGLVNRLMRARMEIAGLLMLVFLALSVFTEQSSALRPVIGQITLGLALAMTFVSYFTSRILEAERLEEEVERLREQLTKSGVDAAARLHGEVVSAAVERLADLGDEIKSRFAMHATGRAGRQGSSAPAIVPLLGSLRADLARELSSVSGPAPLKQQLEQLIGAAGSMRAALK